MGPDYIFLTINFLYIVYRKSHHVYRKVKGKKFEFTSLVLHLSKYLFTLTDNSTFPFPLYVIDEEIISKNSYYAVIAQRSKKL